MTWFCHSLNRPASLLRNLLTGNQTASFYFQVGIYSAVLSHHFARTKYMYILRVVHKKNSLLVKTFVFFISLHTYKKVPFSQQGVVQRHGAKATKNLGAWGGAYLAGLLHVFVYTI